MTRLACKLSLVAVIALSALSLSATPAHAQMFGWRRPVYVSNYYTTPYYYSYPSTYSSGYYPMTTYTPYVGSYTYASGYYYPSTTYSSYYYTPTYTVPSAYYYTPNNIYYR